MDPMLESFISESRENLETAGRCFLKLEKMPDDEELLNDLFRSIHTIKGSSGLFDIPGFTRVVHAAEDALDMVRSGDLNLTSEHIDLFLDTMDQVSTWLDDLEDSGTLAEGAEASSQLLTQSLRLIQGENEPGESDDASAMDVDTETESAKETVLTEPPSWLCQMPDDNRLVLFKRTREEEIAILAIEYTPDSQCFFSGDDPLHTVRSLPGNVWFNIQAREAWPEPMALDPYQCNLIFHVLAAGDESEIRHYLRYVTEQIEITTLSPLQLILPTGKAGDSEPFQDFVNKAPQVLAKRNWEQLQHLITPLLEISDSELFQFSVLRWMDTLLQQKDPDPVLLDALLNAAITGEYQWSEALTGVSATDAEKSMTGIEKVVAINATSPQQLSSIQLEAATQTLAAQKQILSMPCPPELISGRIASVSTVVANLLHIAGHPTTELEQAKASAQAQASLEPLAAHLASLTLHSTATEQEPSPSEAFTEPPANERHQVERRKGERRRGDRREKSAPATTESVVAQSKILKVDQQRIDALMDLVGELVVAKNALPFLAKRAEEDFGVRALAKEIKAHSAVINRLSEELQSAMMQIRMVPISTVFQRFPRLVRDLSRKLGKQIRLELEGEETEADKNVVESLADPLIHLVRNSLDHGLETAAEREAAGKPVEGTIILRAIPHDDQVLIEIVDDGRGIDPEVIKRKAYEKGIIDEQRLDAISDQEALQLILTAGFSTAEEVSDLSGRGVGMDVVRTAVNQAGGSIMIESKPGLGTTIRLALPLSMTVNRMMMIEVAGQSYGISMEDIVETVRVPANSIQRIKHNEAIVLRDRLIPLFHLRHLLQLEPVSKLPEEVAVLVMALGGEELGLVIDEFNEGIDIIQKPLEGVMANYPYYSGAALLGDGRVLLVLNIRELLTCR